MSDVTQADQGLAHKLIHGMPLKEASDALATYRQQAVDEATRPLVEALGQADALAEAGMIDEAMETVRQALAQHTGAK